MNLITKISGIALLTLLAATGVSAQSKSAQRHSNAHRELLANQGSNKDQIKLIEKNTFIDLIDDIEPEIDIYTEGWNSKRVNPFSANQVPDKMVIDVTGFVMPCAGRMTSNYGYRAKFGRMHKGVDIGIRNNDTIRAAFDGKVRLTNYEAKGYGNYIIVRHPNGLETVYGHLNRALVKPDQVVKAGQPIGLGGSTGRSTGPHLHFETRFMGYAINPNAIVDFANKCTHTDSYTFSKATYTQPRNYAPRKQTASEKGNAYHSGQNIASSYTVKKGDTLSSIARSYGLSATTLRKLNGLGQNDMIKAGQVLKLK